MTKKELKSNFLILLLTIATTFTEAQNLQWAKSFGNTSSDAGASVKVDNEGNIYTIGYFTGNVDFDPGVGLNTLTATPDSYQDIFIQKLDASGNFLWAKTFGGPFIDYYSSFCIDSNGNLFITGIFQYTRDFDPGLDTFNITAQGIFSDIYLLKLDAQGNFIWAKSFGGPANDNVNSITIDNSGNIYTTGSFNSTVDFDPSVQIFELTSAGLSDAFVQKMTSSGNFIWAKRFGNNNGESSNSITIDMENNIYTIGNFSGTVDFDPGSGVSNLASSGGQLDTDIYLQKMDSSGAFIWARRFGGIANDLSILKVTSDAFGNIYSTGYFKETIDFDPSASTTNLTATAERDFFIQKMDVGGNFLWAKSFGGNQNDESNAILTDISGNVYVTGFFNGTVDFDPSNGVVNLNSVLGSEDIFILVLDSSGALVWAKSLGGNLSDSGNDICFDNLGSLLATGSFRSTVDFDAGPSEFSLTAVGNSDCFLLKMSQSSLNIFDNSSNYKMAAFPNPNKGILEISFQEPMNNVEITISDIQGKEIYFGYFNSLSKEKIFFDGSAGIYFLKLKTTEFQNVVKLIKE
jgi:hypothetical protein